MRGGYVQRCLRNHNRHLLSEEPNGISLGTGTITPDTCISVIKQCGTIKALKSVHGAMLRSHLHLNLHFSTNLISQYASLGSISHAYALFSSSRTSDLFLWNVMIRSFTENGLYKRSILLYRQMREIGIQPDNFTFPFVLKACGYFGGVEFGRKVHSDAVGFGYESDVFVANSLIAMYGKCEEVGISRQLFDKMPERNVISWSAMLGAYAQNLHYEEGLSLFGQMLDARILPSRSVILNAIQCVHRESEANEICRIIVDNGLDSDQTVRSATMGMYSRCGRIDISRKIFDEIVDKDLVSWSSMIEAYARADLPLEALELFREFKLQVGIPLDFVTVLSAIRACSNLASFRQARFIHGFTIRNSFQHELMIETALIDLYIKCGNIEHARQVFNRMQERNIVSWSTMISGYGIHGRGREALDLFDQMKVLMKPDSITFVSVLSACSHSGLTAEGWKCFNSMTMDFGVTPSSEHYACMVDLLGRAGQLNEAKEFIDSMPMRPDSGVWGALLGACRIHLNLELAELAAEHLFELDPENPGRYVLLFNIYKSKGKVEEAHHVRALMKRRGVRKTASHTIIEVKNKAYKFTVGDRLNAQTEMIVLYEELDRLMERIQEEGYVPDTSFALHDVEEEMKEKSLYLHSEKLAIVFGLVHSSPNSVIRIKKNLRVCGDCHTATKFISKVTGREIVARDAHRFHHFKGGSCSCGDYW